MAKVAEVTAVHPAKLENRSIAVRQVFNCNGHLLGDGKRVGCGNGPGRVVAGDLDFNG